MSVYVHRNLLFITCGELEAYETNARKLRGLESHLERIKNTFLGDEEGRQVRARLGLFPGPVEGDMEAENANGNEMEEEEALPGWQAEEETMAEDESGNDQILDDSEPFTLPYFLQDQEGEVADDGDYCHNVAILQNTTDALPRVKAAPKRAAENGTPVPFTTRKEDNKEAEAGNGEAMDEEEAVDNEGERNSYPPKCNFGREQNDVGVHFCHMYEAERRARAPTEKNRALESAKIRLAPKQGALSPFPPKTRKLPTCSRCQVAFGVEVRTKGHNCPYDN